MQTAVCLRHRGIFDSGFQSGLTVWRDFVGGTWRIPLPSSALFHRLIGAGSRTFADSAAYEYWLIEQFLRQDGRNFSLTVQRLCQFCAKHNSLAPFGISEIVPSTVLISGRPGHPWPGPSWLRFTKDIVEILVRTPNVMSGLDARRNQLAVFHELGHLFDPTVQVDLSKRKSGLAPPLVGEREVFAHAFGAAIESQLFVAYAYNDSEVWSIQKWPHDNALFEKCPPPAGMRMPAPAKILGYASQP